MIEERLEARALRLQNVFLQAWKQRYGETHPPFDTKELKVFTHIAQHFNRERGIQIVQTYLKMDDPKFLEVAHKPLLMQWKLTRVQAEGKILSLPRIRV